MATCTLVPYTTVEFNPRMACGSGVGNKFLLGPPPKPPPSGLALRWSSILMSFRPCLTHSRQPADRDVMRSRDSLANMTSGGVRGIVFGVDHQMALRVDRHMFLAWLVDENEAVKVLPGAAADGGGFESREFLCIRQPECRHIGRIIHASDNDGLIRIAFLERDDDFMADARPEKRPPAFSRPNLSHAQPA